MKKSIALISLAAFMVFFSCKKDDDKSPFDVKYTSETPEQSKQNVEDNAVDFVEQLGDLSSATAIEVMMNLNNLGDGPIAKSAPLNPLSMVASIDKKTAVASIFEQLKAFEEKMATDPISFSAIFDSMCAKYTWDPQAQEFVESELADKVVFEFPGKENDATNTASLTIDNFTVSEFSDPYAEWPEEIAPELPASINIDLKYNTVSIAGASFEATYKSDGMPTKVKVEVYVDDFTFTTTATHSPYTSASWTNTLKFKEDILLETYIAAAGNWSEENIENNVNETDYDVEVNVEEIIKNANAHVILMNLKVIGQVNIKGIADKLQALEEDESITSEEELYQRMVDIINENAKLIVIYRDSNTKIAEAEAYVDSYFGDYDISMRFVYADGTYVDVETYTESELDNFYTALNEFIADLNAEYGLSIDPVNP